MIAAAPKPPKFAAATHRHVKRGTFYRVIGEASVQSATPIKEGDKLTVYQGTDGALWARPKAEFNDGRFEVLSQEAGDAATGRPTYTGKNPDRVAAWMPPPDKDGIE